MTAISEPTLRAIGRQRLDLYIEANLGARLWPKQKEIARALSKPRARVIVRSCHASGKSFIAPALALAFYDCFPDAKVITTAGSNEDHLKKVFWGELRRHHRRARIPVDGYLPPSDMRLEDQQNELHFIVGHVPNAAVSMHGYHGPKVLVVVDEATAVDPEVGEALESLMTTSDARMLLVFNPTVEGTWAHALDSAPNTISIPIRAWDTPLLSHFTKQQIKDRWGADVQNHRPVKQDVPPGADLLTPEFLDEMVDGQKGPGTSEWNAKIEAQYWSGGSNTLVVPQFYDLAAKRKPRDGAITLGIDLGLWGDSESVIQVRKGNGLLESVIRQGMLPERFWIDVIAKVVEHHRPEMVVFDADGAGAGTVGLAKKICGDSKVFPFRGSYALGNVWTNARSMWWWRLKERFESGDIAIPLKDASLRQQVLGPTYSTSNKGLIQVETKKELRRPGRPGGPIRHIDRADALVYAFGHDAPFRRVDLDNDPTMPVDEDPTNPYEHFGRELRKARGKQRAKPVRTAGSGLRVSRRR